MSAPKPKILEKDVAQQIKDSLLRRGWYPIRLQTGLFKTPDGRFVKMGEPGLPDYVCVHQRHPAFFLETKRPKGELSPAQIRESWVLQTAYKLAVTVAQDVDTLLEFLDCHEAASEVR